MNTVSEIISTASGPRRPISRTCAYTRDKSWYHRVGSVSIGRAIGNTVSLTGGVCLVYDLIRNWSEGHFWRRSLFFVGALGGLGASLVSGKVRDLFDIDLLTSALVKFADRFANFSKDKSRVKRAGKISEKYWKELETAVNKLATGSVKDSSNCLKTITFSMDRIFEPLGINFNFKFDKGRKLIEMYVCSKELFSHEASRADTQYKPFIAIPPIPIKSFLTWIKEINHAVKTKKEFTLILDLKSLNEKNLYGR